MWLLLLTGCLAPLDDSPTGIFEYVWNDFDAFYGGFDQRGVDWDEVYDTWRPEVSDKMSDDDLYEVLGGMIATLDDGHVRMVAPGRELYESNYVFRDDTLDGTFDIDVVRDNYLTGPIDTGDWDWYVYAMAGDRIPYLWLPGIDDNTHVIDTIADENPNARAFIIDLRHSGGGAFTFALHGLGRLAKNDTYIYKSRSRSGPERGTFDDWTRWDQPARTPHWDVPLIVLTDEITISASERVLIALQALPNTTTLGTRTNGAQATSVGHEAPNGWSYQLPVQEVVAWDGEVYEGVGCRVDVELANDPEDVLNGIDTVLEAAIELAESGG